MAESRVLPHDLSAENSLLGAMLLSVAAIEIVEPMLTPTDFYNPAGGNIYEAILVLWRNGDPVDVVTVGDVLTRTGLLESVGGAAGLTKLMMGTPSTGNARRYAQIVLEMAQYRKVIAVAYTAIEDGFNRSGDPGDLVDSLGKNLAALDAEMPADVPDDLTTLQSFLSRPEETKAPWVVPGLIRRGWRVMIVAGEGAGKTTLLRQIGLGVAGGIHPMWHDVIDPVRTLIVDLENPEESIDLMCKPIMDTVRGRNQEMDEDNLWLWHRPGGIDLRTRRDRIALEQVIQKVKPELVCLGPLYKSYRYTAKEGGDEIAAGEVQNILDDLRTRYGFGLLIEHHPPHGDARASRVMRPHGSSLWLRWPEIGIGLDPVRDTNGSFFLSRWRGDRLPNMWPDRIDRSTSGWPWKGVWPDGTFDRASLSEDEWVDEDDEWVEPERF